MAAGNKFIQEQLGARRAAARLKKDCNQFEKIVKYLQSTGSTVYLDWGTYTYENSLKPKKQNGGICYVNTEVVTDGEHKWFITTSLLLKAMNLDVVRMRYSGNINGKWYVSRDGKFTNTEPHIAQLIQSVPFPNKVDSLSGLLTLI